MTGTLAKHIATSVDETSLPQRAGEDGFDAVDQPGGAIRDDQQRVAQPTLGEPGKKADHASVDSAPPGSSPTNTGLPSVVMPHAASTGSAREPVCILNMDASKNK